MPDRSQAAWPLGGAEVAGSGLVPSSPGQASCRSLGQAPCRARWVRLRAEPCREERWARSLRSYLVVGVLLCPLSVACLLPQVCTSLKFRLIEREGASLPNSVRLVYLLPEAADSLPASELMLLACFLSWFSQCLPWEAC